MRLADKIRRLVGVRSPTLERCGYYMCCNCAHRDHSCFCELCYDDNLGLVRCGLYGNHVYGFGTCKRHKPIKIKPLRRKWWKPQALFMKKKFNFRNIDEWGEKK